MNIASLPNYSIVRSTKQYQATEGSGDTIYKDCLYIREAQDEKDDHPWMEVETGYESSAAWFTDAEMIQSEPELLGMGMMKPVPLAGAVTITISETPQNRIHGQIMADIMRNS